jgi:type I restriction enzyme S subunit
VNYRAYPEYSTTRQSEIGSIPFGWEARRLKFAVSLRNEKIEAENAGLEYMGLEHIESWTGRRIEDETASSEGIATRFEKDDVLFSKLRPYLAKVYLAEKEGMATTEALVMVCEPVLLPAFLKYLLLSDKFIDAVSGTAYGAKMPRANWEDIGGLPIVLPSTGEQQQIAAFLDWKTAQIGVLIAKKKRLLETLKEKRLAVITQAVTKGLNPVTPLRDSGVPWLGQVPEHWQVKRLRFATKRIEQGWSPQCDNQPADDELWGVMKVGCVNGDEFDALENKALPLDLDPMPEYELRPKDILISRANTKELLGSAAIVPENVRSKLLLCDKLFRLRPTAEVDEEYLTCYLRTPAARYQYEREATGSSGSMQNIGQSTIKNLVLFLPPLDEQKVISQYIRDEVAKLDGIVRRTETALAYLTGYRNALITAATMGEIDVRNVKIQGAA